MISSISAGNHNNPQFLLDHFALGFDSDPENIQLILKKYQVIQKKKSSKVDNIVQ